MLQLAMERGSAVQRALRAWLDLPAVLALVSGFAAANFAFATSAEATMLNALGTGVRAAAGAWVMASLAVVMVATANGRFVPPGQATGTPGISPPRSAPAVHHSALWSADVLRIAAAVSVVIIAALQRAPGRLVLNLGGFILLAAPLAWVVGRRAGQSEATRAVVALGVLAVYATHVNLPRGTAFDFSQAQVGSPFRWSIGVPQDGWFLRHEVQLDGPARERGGELLIPLASRYAGPARVFARLNGHELGELRGADRGYLLTDIPASSLAGHSRLTLELRQSAPDQSLRLVAQRWTAGATLGALSSSYYQANEWHAGTFDDLLGVPRPGIIVVELRGVH
jgi:hypothetical protein